MWPKRAKSSPVINVTENVGNGWRCRYDGNEREPGNLTCLARLGTGGDVDTMGTLQAQIYLMKQKRIKYERSRT